MRKNRQIRDKETLLTAWDKKKEINHEKNKSNRCKAWS